MESFIGAIVLVIQLAAAGFVAWGGWLALPDGFREPASARAQTMAAQTKVDDFERAASLVLLALLCTTLIGAI